MRDTLHGYGLNLQSLVELTAFAKEPREHEAIRKIIADYLPGDYHPALSSVSRGFGLKASNLKLLASQSTREETRYSGPACKHTPRTCAMSPFSPKIGQEQFELRADLTATVTRISF